MAFLNKKTLTGLAKTCGFVMVSESAPIEELLVLGWTAECLRAPKAHEANFRSKAAEWVTMSPKPALA